MYSFNSEEKEREYKSQKIVRKERNAYDKYQMHVWIDTDAFSSPLLTS